MPSLQDNPLTKSCSDNCSPWSRLQTLRQRWRTPAHR